MESWQELVKEVQGSVKLYGIGTELYTVYLEHLPLSSPKISCIEQTVEKQSPKLSSPVPDFLIKIINLIRAL